MTAKASRTSTAPDVGRRLAAARLKRKLSQGTVARLTGLAPSYISRIETGKVHPRFRTVLRITEALKIPLAEVTSPEHGKESPHGSCPITHGGMCLLDLVRPEAESSLLDGESYTPRQLRLLRQFAAWMREVPADRWRAMEILVDDLRRGTGGATGGSRGGHGRAPKRAATRRDRRGGGAKSHRTGARLS